MRAGGQAAKQVFSFSALAALALLAAFAGAPRALSAADDGRAYLARCMAADAGRRAECRDPLLAEVFIRQANQHRVPNPFRACPVDIRRVEALERLGERLHKAFVAWLVAQPEAVLDQPLEHLVHRALDRIDVCHLPR